MDRTARRNAPGHFAPLPRGETHFQWYGSENGSVVVCIHGLTTPSFVWNSIAPALAAKGYHVLTYDLYGRGYSDRPRGPQDPAFFASQLDALLDDQKITGPISLIGYSMGGAIATAYASEGMRSLDEVVLLAPAGMKAVGVETLQRIVHTPFLSRWMMLIRYPALLRRGLRAEADQPSSVPGINALQHAELSFRGFVPAVHESLRGMLTDSFETYHAKLRDTGTPVLAIWGETDDVIPLSAKDRLSAWNPEVTHQVVKGAGHGVTYSHTDAVLAHIFRFLKPAR